MFTPPVIAFQIAIAAIVLVGAYFGGNIVFIIAIILAVGWTLTMLGGPLMMVQTGAVVLAAWRDNIFVERLWRTVKYEEVYLDAYDSAREARTSIMRYLDWYNRSRPHSRLNRQTPDEAYVTMLPAV